MSVHALSGLSYPEGLARDLIPTKAVDKLAGRAAAKVLVEQRKAYPRLFNVIKTKQTKAEGAKAEKLPYPFDRFIETMLADIKKREGKEMKRLAGNTLLVATPLVVITTGIWLALRRRRRTT